MEYEDFVIQIGSDQGDGHPVQVLKSPAGEGRGVFKLSLGAEQIEAILAGGGHAVRSASAVQSWSAAGRDLDCHLPEPAARLSAQQVGDQLFRSLFSGQVQRLFDQSLGVIASRPGCGLRIKLKFDAQNRELSRLSSLPWEFLWRVDTHDFLSLSRLSPVVRYLDVPRQATPILVPATLRILVVISSPDGLTPLDLESERQSLETACRGWKGVDVEVLDRADPSLLRRTLLEKDFHALHFMGHGGFDGETGEGVLHFRSADGRPESVTGQALATFLKDFKTLGLVFLNACDTARTQARGFNPFSGVAGALVLGGLPAVVAMQFPISDRAAITFSAAFYQRLACGDPVDAAVVEGRQAVLSMDSHSLEWGTPVLFLRIPDGEIFRVGPGTQLTTPGAETIFQFFRRRLRKSSVALFLAGLLTLFLTAPVLKRLTTVPTSSAQSLPTGYPVNIGRDFSSTLEGVAGTLTRAEILSNGRMRLHFSFHNSSGKKQEVGLDYQSTYLADPAGNRYRVLTADTPAESASAPIPPGGKIDRWLEFQAPLDQARRFSVSLGAPPDSKGPQFPLFGVDLPQYPRELSVSTTSPKPAPGAALLSVSGSIETNIQGFRSDLRGVELRQDGRMRWSFAFLNGSAHDQTVGLDYSNIYLQDQFGNRYSVLTSDSGGRPGQVFKESLPRALRADHWLEFAAPRQSARSFTVVLAGQQGLKFFPLHVDLPYYPPQYSAPAPTPSTPAPRQSPAPKAVPLETPPPATEKKAPTSPPAESTVEPHKSLVLGAGESFDSSVQGLISRLTAVERLDDGRLRWSFEFVNETGSPLELGFNASETYLADNLGTRYRVVRTDQSHGPGGTFHESLSPGAKAIHWFEFPSPTDGAQRFLVVLGSDSQSLRFRPFPVVLPHR
jgi:hypothetical protein